jgi:asparagine synthase (glutamine-hydrolysing)
MRNGTTKHLLKQSLRGTLPNDIIDRKKKGFAVPLGDWFRHELREFVRDILLSETSRSRGIFNHAYIEKLLAMHQRGRPLDNELWLLLSFELWCRKFLDAAVQPERTLSFRESSGARQHPVAAVGAR